MTYAHFKCSFFNVDALVVLDTLIDLLLLHQYPLLNLSTHS